MFLLKSLNDLQDVSTPQYIIRTEEAENASNGKEERLSAGKANNNIYYNKFVLKVITHIFLAS